MQSREVGQREVGPHEVGPHEVGQREVGQREFGYYEGDVVVQWLREPQHPDRRMKLLADFAYIDPTHQRWIAKTGREVDGASIPEIFWKTVGTPYVGDYRRATVLHDVACDDKIQAHIQVHRMFYYAMRCDGVNWPRAIAMYQAVRLFGPKWSGSTGTEGPLLEPKQVLRPAEMTPADMERLNQALATLHQELSQAQPIDHSINSNSMDVGQTNFHMDLDQIDQRIDQLLQD